MAKSREKKQSEATALVDKFGRMKVAVVTTTSGLKVKDSNELRTILRKSGIDHVVAKKTLMRRAIADAGLTGVNLDSLAQSIAISFGYDDEVTPAKTLSAFAKTHESMKFLGGILEGSFVSPESIQALAMLPSKQELYGRVVGTIAAPLSGFVRVLAGNLTGLVRVLDAHRMNREGAPTAP